MPPSWQSIRTVVRGSRGTLSSSAQRAARSLRRRAFFLFVNLLVAAIVVALPFLVATTPGATQVAATNGAVGGTSLSVDDSRDAGTPVARAQTQARGGTITAGRDPLTVQAAGDSAIVRRTLTKDDTLWTMANFYGLTAEAIASSNGITDPYHLEVGREILIPPAEGTLYTVVEGDTVEGVAARFKVDPDSIRSYNRLYFEPERFANGKVIFIQNAELPTLPAPEPVQATVIARAAPPTSAGAAAKNGFLAWPTGGVITQYFWWGHTGVDIAAPYGTGLAASVNGTISQNGWVAVGGLHICVKSGNLEECYYHLSAAYLPVGTQVSAGQIVAAIGLTGVTTGPHVHWETKVNGQFVNPLAVQP